MKDPANFKIHRMRVIHLYEADYSLLLSVHWRATLHSAEDRKLLNQGTYGSRPNRTAITPVFIEELMLEITRLTRKHLVMFDNDAASCYDRIVTSIMSIISQHYGSHKKVVVVWAKTLEAAQFHLKTGKMVSDKFYQHSTAHPIHGSGQGATNSPNGWLFICSKLFDVHEKHSTGASFCSPDRTQSITLHMIGFVDDTKDQLNDFVASPQPPMQELVKKMEQDAQCWHDLLWISGGALELKKCSYHAVEWFFNKKGFPIMTGGSPPYKLELKKKDGTTHQIKGLSSYKNHKTLGHYKTPSGGSSAQYNAIEKKAIEHAAFLQGNALTAREVYIYYSGFYLPSITYPLAASALSKKDLLQLEKKPINAIVAKTGMCSKTHRAIIFGPKNLGGCAFRSLPVEQGCLQIKLLLTESRRQSDSGKLLWISLQWMQYSSGLGTPLLEGKETCEYSESKWIQSIQTFLFENGIGIQFYKNYVMPLQREADSFIMDHAVQSGAFSTMELHKINHVRLFLQVLTVADISDADGLELNQHQIQEDSQHYRETTYVHVHQDKPPTSSWKLWNCLLALLLDNNGYLKTPLGNWIVPVADLRMQWNKFYSRSEDKYYHISSSSPNDISRYFNARRHIPVDCVPCSSQNTLPISLPKLKTVTIYPISFYNTLDALEEWETTLLDNITLTPGTTWHRIIQEIRNNNIIIASDGSVSGSIGTFGWVIAVKGTGERLVENSGWTFGIDPSSYRSEIYGALSLSRFLFHFYAYYCVQPTKKPTWLCDNESLVDEYVSPSIEEPSASSTPWEINDPLEDQDTNPIPVPLRPDWDVLSTLLKTAKKVPLDAQWIASHQDKKKHISELSVDAQLNCRADQLAARQHLQRSPQNLRLVPPMPTVPTQLVMANGTVTSHHPHQIRRHVTSAPLLKYIIKKNHWSTTISNSVDWPLHSKVVKKMSSPCIIKYLHKCLPVQSTMYRRQQASSPICLRCNLEDESDDHIIRCRCSEEWRASLHQYYLQRTKQLKGNVECMQFIIQALEMHQQSKQLDISTLPQKFQIAFHHQHQIGWNNWYKGRIATSLHRLFLQKGKKKDILEMILSHTLTQWKELWIQRNNIVHDYNESNSISERTKRIHAELDFIYSRRLQYLHKDQDILLDSLEAHKKLPTSSIKNWLILYKTHLSESIQIARKNALVGVTRLTQYFKIK